MKSRILLAAWADFDKCHVVANSVRDQLGYSSDSFPDAAPHTALSLKYWRKELQDPDFARLKKPLRLRYAIDHGFGPGVWAPADVEDTTAADRSFAGRLNNLGVAVRSG